MPVIANIGESNLKRQPGSIGNTAERAQGLLLHTLMEASLDGNAICRTDADY